MSTKPGAKLKVIAGVRYLKGRVLCENCDKPFKLFWREDFILYRHFHCSSCDPYIHGLIQLAKEEEEEDPSNRWPISTTSFDL